MTWVTIGTSAAIGAGTSALTGGDTDDILKGAILGGITGGVTGGMTGGAESALTSATPEMTQAAATMAPEMTQAATTATTAAAPTGIAQAQPMFAQAPVTSDIAQYGTDQSILNAMDAYRNAQPAVSAPVEASGIANIKMPTVGMDQSGQLAYQGITPGGITVPPAAPVSSAPIQTPTYNPNVSFASQVQAPYNMTTLPTPDLAAGMPSVNVASAPTGSLESGFNKALAFAEKNPFLTTVGLGMGLSAMGAFDQGTAGAPERRRYSGSLSRYRMSPDFAPSSPTPNVYQPRYAAEGGIMMARGGDFDDEPGETAFMASGGIATYSNGRRVKDYMEVDPAFQRMMEGPRAEQLPESVSIPRTGIMYDTDPDTRYKDALTAAHIRMGKVAKRAGTGSPGIPRPTMGLGQIDTSPAILKKKKESASDDREDLAAGGITQADRYGMGGYASGSVPRLLKGPGDGMSDDIPASIGGRQPARLADGEFVVPADVVSHLGNGSTDAGAKKLHKMMTDVRRDRTGNPKQGKEIVAEKYIPKKKKRA